jgi:hypothetical protein
MKELKVKDLELGQIMFGNPVGEYECPEYVEALLSHIFEEIDRVYWNIHQETWEEESTPGIPGIKVRPYCWDEDSKEASKPNFKFESVEIRWYKHRGRGMTVNVNKSYKQWIDWFDRCLKVIRKYEPKF